jgi:hypothetical protein
MKKYHQRPTFGVRSGSRRRTPYVAATKSHEPVMKAEVASKAPRATAKPTACVMIKGHKLGSEPVFAVRVSYNKTKSGGKSSIGCIDR